MATVLESHSSSETAASQVYRSAQPVVSFAEAETLAETRAFMREMQDAGGRLLISYTTPFPGTRFYDDADELGLKILTEDWSEYDCKHVVMATKRFSAERIERLATELAESLGMAKTA